MIKISFKNFLAPAFSQFSEKTLRHSLSKLCEVLRDLTNRFNDYDNDFIDSPRAKSPSITNSSRIRNVVNRLRSAKQDDSKASNKSFKNNISNDLAGRLDFDVSGNKIDRKASKDSNYAEIIPSYLEEQDSHIEANTHSESQSNKTHSDVDDQKSFNRSLDDIDDKPNGLTKFSHKIHVMFYEISFWLIPKIYKL
jgi:hypothetical protein